ncbi:NUDIX hydrolase [Parageobacillus toebii]|jgi:8-oxo-dGTP diphosphatase|uniref:NUDIX hydrolase n=1 Tax=Parageobacillus toebii TaxID=153151 RepID=UPI0035B51554
MELQLEPRRRTWKWWLPALMKSFECIRVNMWRKYWHFCGNCGRRATMKRVDVVYVLLYDEVEQKVLMVYNKRGTWSLPGGGVEKGETLRGAAIREVKEETGYDVDVHDIVALNEAFMDGNHVFFITFRGTIVHAPVVISKDENIIDVQWVDIETAEQRMPYHPNGIRAFLRPTSGAQYTIQQ